MLKYLLERFLCRLRSTTGPADLVLEGGLLLAQFGARPTPATSTSWAGHSRARSKSPSAASPRSPPPPSTTASPSDPAPSPPSPRQDDEYHGLRLAMNGTLAARLKLQLDVSFGDPVTPAPAPIEYPQYLTDETFTLYGYPIATVIAEKLSTAIALGDLNARDRDYADLHQLITRHHLDGDSSPPHCTTPPATAASSYARSAKQSPTFRPGAKPPTPHGDDAKATQPKTTPQPSPTSSPPSPRSPIPWQPAPHTAAPGTRPPEPGRLHSRPFGARCTADCLHPAL